MEDEQLGENGFIEKLYEIYQTQPGKLDPSWESYFADLETKFTRFSSSFAPTSTEYSEQKERIFHLIDAYRRFGHLMAKVSTLKQKLKSLPLPLTLKELRFSPEELTTVFPTLGILEQAEAPLKEIILKLQTIYCKQIGFEFKESAPPLQSWIEKFVESNQFHYPFSIKEKELIANCLIRAEEFEKFLHIKYVGQKRFSLQGAETLLPMLTLLLEKGGEIGLQRAVIGMAHRGRLNILANLLQKPYSMIFAEFEQDAFPAHLKNRADVKYHQGYEGVYLTAAKQKIALLLPPNPSHLESIYPVVEGQVKAFQSFYSEAAEKNLSLPILIHGDASIAGQGVIYETLQFSHLKGYKTGGTIHFIINNEVGFTTAPKEARSTLYCSDIAKSFNAPVLHVNAEDVEGAIRATFMALFIRQKFQQDVFIDLNCYRKYGHNEGDEPAFTQPLLYQIIKKKESICSLYLRTLQEKQLLNQVKAEKITKDFKELLEKEHAKVKQNSAVKVTAEQLRQEEASFKPISIAFLKMLAEKLYQVPKELNLHPKVISLLQERLKAVVEEKAISWPLAEQLAFATLLWENFSIRLSGQDVKRGTFSQRHAVWIDQTTAEEYYPFNHLKKEQGNFSIYNSSLSEMAVMGFEYGYSVCKKKSLTIWEAQYGDFSNGAQIIIDQYLSSAEEKWGQTSNLVLFLPHGYEGQGPEHSSARLERFLSLFSQSNMIIANLTTPAQLFHLLRLHLHQFVLKPLILFTPKALLRLPECASPLKELVQEEFRTILDDPSRPSKATRLVFCSGHLYYSLSAKQAKAKQKVALIRIEQIAPLDEKKIREIINHYPEASQFYWAQEEPQNMGAWTYLSYHLNRCLPQGSQLIYVGREPRAAPATGSYLYHTEEEEKLITEALSI